MSEIGSEGTLRNRLIYLLLLIVIIVVGLNTRAGFASDIVPYFLGDVLYATMMFVLIGILFPRMNSIQLLFISMGICYLIELSQLYKADWMVQLRKYKMVGLVLGRRFFWGDLIKISLGSLLGFGIEKLLMRVRPAFFHPKS